MLQPIYHNQLQILNNKLALLGAYPALIATALLVPNTIATVAGNSMFQFSAGHIPLYLATITIATIISTFASWGR